MSTLGKNLAGAALKAGGAHKTRTVRVRHVTSFADFLSSENIRIEKIEHIKASYIRDYVAFRQETVAIRTLANEMASLRKVLKTCGRKNLVRHPELSNESLGLTGARRKGTNRPMPKEVFIETLKNAVAMDPGIAAILLLSRALGLRVQEAVQSCKHLKTWQKVIETGETHVQVIFGTKGSHPRTVKIHNREAVTQAVEFALAVAKQRRNKLIEADNLKSAMSYFYRVAKKIGLTKEWQYTHHSLRYAFAEDAIEQHLLSGLTEREALAFTSCDLGHGDGRGRYVKSVYAQTILVTEKGSDSSIERDDGGT